MPNVNPADSSPWLTEARKLVGLKEIVGSRHEAKVLQFFAEAGHPEVHDDETAWCAAFVGAMLRRSGYSSSGALNARSYLNYGTKLASPKPGCIVVYKRGNSGWEGHVNFFTRKVGSKIYGIGGNQSNAVNETSMNEADVLGYRWPLIKSAPASVNKPPVPAVEKVKDAVKVGGGATITATVATGVQQGWTASQWAIAVAVVIVVAVGGYFAFRWWQGRKVSAMAYAAVSEALAPTANAIAKVAQAAPRRKAKAKAPAKRKTTAKKKKTA